MGATLTAGGNTANTDSEGNACVDVDAGASVAYSLEPNVTGLAGFSGTVAACWVQVCVTLTGCPFNGASHAPFPGVVVTWSQGGVALGTSTTNGSGVACWSSSPLNGGITAIWDSPGTGYSGGTQSFPWSVLSSPFGPSYTSTAETVIVPLQAGFTCNGPWSCCPSALGGGALSPAGPLFLTDAVGVVELDLGVDVFGNLTFNGCASRGVPSYTNCVFSGGTTAVVYIFSCTPGMDGFWSLSAYVENNSLCPGDPTNTGCPFVSSGDGYSLALSLQMSSALTTCDPFAWEGTATSGYDTTIFPGSGLDFTITS